MCSRPLPVPHNVSGPLACKVCGSRSALDGVVDFNKNASEPNGVMLPLLGVPVYYHRCSACGSVFTVAFDDWPPEAFRAHIYNDDYVTVDPDYAEQRPLTNAAMVANFVARSPGLRILDYGGGNARLAQALTAQGLNAASWDPMEPGQPRPTGSWFDLITSFEVMEHTPTPVETFAEMLAFLAPGGVMLFSTLTVDSLPVRELNHWYIAPRNGHITIHTRRSLAALAARFGRRMHHFNDLMHLCFADLPGWLSQGAATRA